ncbi:MULTISPECIES: TIGR04211 family SH3 domain-containing protein [unclassified Pseudomonas]|uniref:TIGR04211 family SH3 domain-containing protein n=1 Tax=unclassified Pseudomonas TaxID=196821 RepID=UPI000C6E369D|nr:MULTISPECIES: TIGR04211 family SH3 domain-containing protein [unclassified Pseudomonas]QYX49279.1 SH3 domain-containing protein [Pseudomonas sp. S11A 273]
MPISRPVPAALTPDSPALLRPRNRLSLGVIGALIALSGPLQAEETTDTGERWVSDSLTTFVRSGPTNGHRIVGNLKSGQKVTLLSTQGNYSQVRGESGDIVWITSSDLQAVPGQAERLPQLTEQVTQLSEQLKTIDDSWKARVQGMQETLDSRKALIDELEARSKALNAELSDTQSELRSTQARLGDENKHVLMRYMVYGGGIAGAGLLAGLILPALSRGRKRNDRWF